MQNGGVGQWSVSIRIYTMTKSTVKATESVTVYSALVTGKSDISWVRWQNILLKDPVPTS